jgi:hypothetical protein
MRENNQFKFHLKYFQVPGRMGLLITTSLIMVNTYGNVDTVKAFSKTKLN